MMTICKGDLFNLSPRLFFVNFDIFLFETVPPFFFSGACLSTERNYIKRYLNCLLVEGVNLFKVEKASGATMMKA